jgi:hypothetical protein
MENSRRPVAEQQRKNQKEEVVSEIGDINTLTH